MAHRLCDVAPRDPLGSLPRYPSPEELLRAGSPHPRGHARLGYRADSVLRLCEGLLEGRLDLGPAERGELEGPALAYWFEFLGAVDPVTWRGWERPSG